MDVPVLLAFQNLSHSHHFMFHQLQKSFSKESNNTVVIAFCTYFSRSQVLDHIIKSSTVFKLVDHLNPEEHPFGLIGFSTAERFAVRLWMVMSPGSCDIPLTAARCQLFG